MRNRSWLAALAVSAMVMGPGKAADVADLERQLEAARIEAPIVVDPFLAVTKPAQHFGNYVPRKDTVYGRGESMYFYAEPKNLVVPRNADGIYKPAFAIDLEVRAADGKTLREPDYAKFAVDSRSRIQDIYLNLEVRLRGAPPGKYDVMFTIRDANSDKNLTFGREVTIR